MLLIVFGFLCLFGAYKAFTGGHWPGFMPPKLDLFAVPLSWISERLGAYVGGTIATGVGVVCVIGGLFSANRRNAA
ncbi:hypothetical protein [Aquabacterium humicola]|uniref:hypothetical protein n=1 Tax=Aquabacterium humicola TaxID=3237377 RepID=UPI002542DFEF|nr:hypothetical protein [Rubrivivax pictus]